MRFLITPGQARDITAALEGQEAGAVLADKAYDSNDLRQRIADMKAEAVIPSKRNRKVVIPLDTDILQAPQPYRAMLQSPQTLSSVRHALRSPHNPLLRHRPPRRRHDLDTMNVDWP
ncbi:transposase [Mesorhizobium sp. A556]